MAAGRVEPQVCESLIRRDQPALFLVHTPPQGCVRAPLPSLRDDGQSIMTVCRKEVGHLVWQVFINLDPYTYDARWVLGGIKSVWFTASAANFNAA